LLPLCQGHGQGHADLRRTCGAAPQSVGSRAIFALCHDDKATTLLGFLAEIPKDDRPIAAAFAVEHFLGLDS